MTLMKGIVKYCLSFFNLHFLEYTKYYHFTDQMTKNNRLPKQF